MHIRYLLLIALLPFLSQIKAQSLADLDNGRGFQNFKFDKNIKEYPDVEKVEKEPNHYMVKDPTTKIINFTANKVILITDENNKIKEIQLWVKTRDQDQILPSLEYAYGNSEMKYILFNRDVYEWRGNYEGLRFQPGVRWATFTFFKIK